MTIRKGEGPEVPDQNSGSQDGPEAGKFWPNLFAKAKNKLNNNRVSEISAFGRVPGSIPGVGLMR